MIGGGGGREFPIFRSLKMPSPTTLRAKDKQKVTNDDVLALDDLGDATNSGSSDGFSSDGDSDSDTGSNSVSDSDSSSGLESESGAKSEVWVKEGPPLSRDDLLAYLESMRRRFSTKPTTDSFADQEEVLAVTSEKKQGLTRLSKRLRLTYLVGIYRH